MDMPMFQGKVKLNLSMQTCVEPTFDCHCWEPTVFPGEKRIENGVILVFVVNNKK